MSVTVTTAQTEEIALTLSFPKAKDKAKDSYIACITGKPDQPCFTINEVEVDQQESMVLQR